MTLGAWESGATRTARWLAGASGVVLLAIAGLMIADAVLRYGFSRPIAASVELAEQMLGLAMFLALPLAGLSDAHVRIDSVVNRFGRRGQAFSLALGAVLMATLLGAIAWQMSSLLVEMYRTQRVTITARIPVAPFLAIALAGTVLACAASILRMIVAVCKLVPHRTA